LVVELEAYAVDARPETCPQLVLGLEAQDERRRKGRDLDMRRFEFVASQRRKARIAKRGGERVLAHVEHDVTRRAKAADAAAQVAAVKKRDERRSQALQRRMLRRADRETQLDGDRSPRDA